MQTCYINTGQDSDIMNEDKLRADSNNMNLSSQRNVISPYRYELRIRNITISAILFLKRIITMQVLSLIFLEVNFDTLSGVFKI